jgi:hypothetical protein
MGALLSSNITILSLAKTRTPPGHFLTPKNLVWQIIDANDIAN